MTPIVITALVALAAVLALPLARGRRRRRSEPVKYYEGRVVRHGKFDEREVQLLLGQYFDGGR